MLTAKAMEYINLGTGGSYSLARDAIAHRIWDTRSFGSTAQGYTFFSQPVGSAWIGGTAKTVNEVNIYDSGKLPNGQTFLINRFGVALVSINASAVTTMSQLESFATLLSSSVFEIKLQGRDFDFQCHGRNLLPMPLYGSDSSGTNGRVGDFITSGWMKLDPTPIFLDQLVGFQVNHRLQNPVPALQTILDTAASDLSTYYGQMMVILDGFLTRAK